MAVRCAYQLPEPFGHRVHIRARQSAWHIEPAIPLVVEWRRRGKLPAAPVLFKAELLAGAGKAAARREGAGGENGGLTHPPQIPRKERRRIHAYGAGALTVPSGKVMGSPDGAVPCLVHFFRDRN